MSSVMTRMVMGNLYSMNSILRHTLDGPYFILDTHWIADALKNDFCATICRRYYYNRPYIQESFKNILTDIHSPNVAQFHLICIVSNYSCSFYYPQICDGVFMPKSGDGGNQEEDDRCCEKNRGIVLG